MTLFGLLVLIFVGGGVLCLFSEAMKCAMHIDKWSDLWRGGRH